MSVYSWGRSIPCGTPLTDTLASERKGEGHQLISWAKPRIFPRGSLSSWRCLPKVRRRKQVFPHAATASPGHRRPIAGRGRFLCFPPLVSPCWDVVKGDITSWRVPGGVGRFRIEKVLYEPEAEGHFSL